MDSAADSATTAKCVECHQTFLIDNMIRHKNVYVCAGCKPRFMQKLAEGVDVDKSDFRYVGFWIRFGASFLDGLIVIIASFIIGLVTGMTTMQIIGLESRPTLLFVVYQLLAYVAAISYETILVGRYGATLGKMAFGIRVVVSDGSRVSYLRAFGRYFAKIVSALIIYIGFIMAAFDPQKRALHDRICNTRVVMK